MYKKVKVRIGVYRGNIKVNFPLKYLSPLKGEMSAAGRQRGFVGNIKLY